MYIFPLGYLDVVHYCSTTYLFVGVISHHPMTLVKLVLVILVLSFLVINLSVLLKIFEEFHICMEHLPIVTLVGSIWGPILPRTWFGKKVVIKAHCSSSKPCSSWLRLNLVVDTCHWKCPLDLYFNSMDTFKNNMVKLLGEHIWLCLAFYLKQTNQVFY